VQGDEKRTHEKNESNTGFISNRIVPERHQEGCFINLIIDFSEIKRVKIRYRVFRYKKQKGELQWYTVHTRKLIHTGLVSLAATYQYAIVPRTICDSTIPEELNSFPPSRFGTFDDHMLE